MFSREIQPIFGRGVARKAAVEWFQRWPSDESVYKVNYETGLCTKRVDISVVVKTVCVAANIRGII